MTHVSRRRSGPTYRAKGRQSGKEAKDERGVNEDKGYGTRGDGTGGGAGSLRSGLGRRPASGHQDSTQWGATGVAPTANIDAYFNQDVAASTVTSRTFKIRKKGTTTWLGATRSVNNTISPTSTNGSSGSVVTLNPDADLAPNTIYQVVIVGGTSGVKGVNGEVLSTNKKWTFTTANATTPPDTTIDSGPTGTVTSDSASFSFSSSKSGSTFQCSLDSSPFSECTSPKSYTGLINGSHTFQVREIDPTTGTTDPTPASRSWTVNKATGVTVTPTTLDLSPTSENDELLWCTHSANLTVTNNGPGDVTFADVSITGTDAKYFSDGAKRSILSNGPFTVQARNTSSTR